MNDEISTFPPLAGAGLAELEISCLGKISLTLFENPDATGRRDGFDIFEVGFCRWNRCRIQMKIGRDWPTAISWSLPRSTYANETLQGDRHLAIPLDQSQCVSIEFQEGNLSIEAEQVIVAVLSRGHVA